MQPAVAFIQAGELYRTDGEAFHALRAAGLSRPQKKIRLRFPILSFASDTGSNGE